MLKRISTVNRIIYFNLAILILFIGITSVFVYYYAKSSLSKNSRQETLRTLSSTSEQAESMIYSLNQSSKLLASKMSVLNILQYPSYYALHSSNEYTEMISALNDFVFLNENVESTFLFDNYDNTYGTKYFDYDYDLLQIDEALADSPGQMIWYTQDGISQIALCRQFYSATLKPVGKIIIVLKDDIFRTIFQWQQHELMSEVSVVDTKNNKLLYTTSPAAGAFIQNHTSQKPFRDVSLHEHLLINGRMHTLYLYENTGNGFLYCYFIPESYFTQGLEYIISVILIIAAIYVIIVIALTFRLNKSINRPLKLIGLNLRTFSIKKDIIPIEFTHNDEFEDLYQNFCEMAHRINRLVETTYEQEILNKEQEILILQAQINPHFIYNTFELINSVAISHQAPQVCSITKSLSNIMRYTIGSEQFEVTLKDEMEHIHDYITIHQERFMGGLSYIHDVPAELLRHNILKLTLQPIVENCILHAFKGRWKNCLITVVARKTGNGFAIDISDNGCGMEHTENILAADEHNKPKKGNGIAVKNIHRRLQIRYGSESGIHVESVLGKGTTVTVYIVEQGGENV